jgi:hypothetical protein
MLIDNIGLLKTKYPQLWTALKENEERFRSETVVVETAKNGFPTLKIENEGRSLYVHSKYNPQQEAESFVDQFDQTEVESYKHVFFYGLGLGYHIQAFMNKYPHMLFTVYEPNPEVFYKYLDHRLLSELPLKQFQHIYMEVSPDVIINCLSHFLTNVNEKVLLVTQSSYERIYSDKTKDFSEKFKIALSQQINSLGVNMRFERLWTLNSLLNFPKVLESEHMIREKKEIFAGKPALLVAAGPSLEDEIENLRIIKEQGLAYIFSVGSAIKSLLKHGIRPDAVTAYDPETGLEGLDTFQEIIEAGITDIPLIFGSSLGFNTVRRYTGPLKHVFINQDTVSPFYLGNEQVSQNNGLVSDAPSIALVTLEILAKLGCNPVVLVGQNFAYRGDQYYASGIEYATRPNEVTTQDKASFVETESVNGGVVYTSKTYNQTRNGMETYIARMRNIEVINTTQGGAKIEGAAFQSLEMLFKERWKEQIVSSNWYEGDKSAYDHKFIASQAELMEKEYQVMKKVMNDMIAIFRIMEKLITSNNAKQLDKQFPLFDKCFKKLQRNLYYKVYLQPMLRVQEQVLYRYVSDIRNTAIPSEKARKIIDQYGKFLLDCKNEMTFIDYEYNKLQQYLLQQTSDQSETKVN